MSWSNPVPAIYFDDGQRVEQGQVLAEMTSAEEHALLEEGRVRVAEAERQMGAGQVPGDPTFSLRVLAR